MLREKYKENSGLHISGIVLLVLALFCRTDIAAKPRTEGSKDAANKSAVSSTPSPKAQLSRQETPNTRATISSPLSSLLRGRASLNAPVPSRQSPPLRTSAPAGNLRTSIGQISISSRPTPGSMRQPSPGVTRSITTTRSNFYNKLKSEADSTRSSLPPAELRNSKPAETQRAPASGSINKGSNSLLARGRILSTTDSSSTGPRFGRNKQTSEKSQIDQPEPQSQPERVQKPKNIDLGASTEVQNRSRSRNVAPRNQATVINDIIVTDARRGDESRQHHFTRFGRQQVHYYDRPHDSIRSHRYLYMFYDWHNYLRFRIIWPSYNFEVCYWWGPYCTYRYVYPYYLRKYMFVSIGGCWPMDYYYARYYWYGYHPYYWCGYYPVAREIAGNTYNYYTYNYYYNNDSSAANTTKPAELIKPPDENLNQQQREPDEPTAADFYFDEAVKDFEQGDYANAMEKFAQAKELAPDDVVLPFAYCQALFAGQQYNQAAEMLRAALAMVRPEEQSAFYPRGLYPNDEVLFKQIDRLVEQAQNSPYDPDLQLLLGYQMLGIGSVEESLEPLHNAAEYPQNEAAVKVLLDLAGKIQAEQSRTENINQ